MSSSVDRGSFDAHKPCTCTPHCEVKHGDQAESDEQLEVYRLRERVARLQVNEKQVEVLTETLRLMISYLGHQDQDANHLWMVKKMREALDGRHPGASIEEDLAEFDVDDPLSGVVR